MRTKVITKENKHIGDPYHTEIIDAVHNGLDSVLFGEKRVNVISVYTADDAKVIVVDITHD